MNSDNNMNTQSPRERTRSRRMGAVPAAVVGLALVAGVAAFVATRPSGPTSPGVAHLGPTPTTGASPTQSDSTQTKAAAYSSCMRSHGVPSFPDPDSQGHLNLKFTKGGALDPSSPQFQAAQQACKRLAPSQNTSTTNAQFSAQALKFSACMRSHGVPKFPDPKTSGGVTGLLITGINPHSPQFQAAMQACRSLMPGGGPGPGQ
jgi:hypothetical protein